MQNAVVRKHRPGQTSEYGRQLSEKQVLRNSYLLREKQFKNYVQAAVEQSRKGGDSRDLLLQYLERRLDNTVFRMGFAQTRNQAKQMVSHGHILVNGRKVGVASYRTKVGDVIAIRPQSLEKVLFKNASLAMKKYEAPSWIALNKEEMKGTVQGLPTVQEANPGVDIPLIFEFYSR
ncbi:MAG: 30S ribosomal protein S4 [Parcubacteria group bacterium]|nr:30S ribosomal protein S4 [Parcubacteria group bacterium]